MKTENDKEIEQLVQKLMGNSQLESPSFEFTSKVMQQVNGLSKSESTIYRSLIPRKVWWLLLIAFLALVLYVLLGAQSKTDGWISYVPLENFKIPQWNILSGVEFSKTAMYGMVMLALMMMVQIPLLKYYFNNRLKL